MLQRRARVRVDQRSLWTDETLCSFSRRAGLCDAGVRALRVEVVSKLMSLSPGHGEQSDSEPLPSQCSKSPPPVEPMFG